jgi:hypothetical protein
VSDRFPGLRSRSASGLGVAIATPCESRMGRKAGTPRARGRRSRRRTEPIRGSCTLHCQPSVSSRRAKVSPTAQRLTLAIDPPLRRCCAPGSDPRRVRTPGASPATPCGGRATCGIRPPQVALPWRPPSGMSVGLRPRLGSRPRLGLPAGGGVGWGFIPPGGSAESGLVGRFSRLGPTDRRDRPFRFFFFPLARPPPVRYAGPLRGWGRGVFCWADSHPSGRSGYV